MAKRFRVTYATLSADNEELQAAYDEGLGWLRSGSAQTSPGTSAGSHAPRPARSTRAARRPVAHLCRVHSATPADVEDAVARRGGRAPRLGRDAMAGTGRRCCAAAADLISERSNELAALMSMEVGKNRLEALGDVEESADLIRYYCTQIEANDGFSRPMDRLSEHETTRSVHAARTACGP